MEGKRAAEVRRGVKDPLRHRSPGGFRTVELNAAGWSTLAGAGLAAGGLSTVAGTPAPVALPAGVVAAWLVALGLDYARWRNGYTGIGRGGLDAATGEEIVGRLRAIGVDASYEEQTFDEPDGSVYVQRTIRCRNPDEAKVRRMIDEVLRP